MSPYYEFRRIDENTFIDKFRPQRNPLDLTASLDFGDGGCLYSAAGKEFRHVLAQDPRTLWTLVEGDDGSLFIESGLHIVNRLGYLVTARPFEDGVAYSVPLE
jgi:hypothetical protein